MFMRAFGGNVVCGSILSEKAAAIEEDEVGVDIADALEVLTFKNEKDIEVGDEKKYRYENLKFTIVAKNCILCNVGRNQTQVSYKLNNPILYLRVDIPKGIIEDFKREPDGFCHRKFKSLSQSSSGVFSDRKPRRAVAPAAKAFAKIDAKARNSIRKRLRRRLSREGSLFRLPKMRIFCKSNRGEVYQRTVTGLGTR
jgi:hypothetical protein